MNMPVSNFRRDEAYTFIHGIGIACTWFLYLSKINVIDPIKSIASPTFMMGWLTSTAILYILYSFLVSVISISVEKKLKKINDDELLKDQKVVKFLSLFYVGPLEEQRIVTHIFGLLTTTLLIVYHPIFSYLTPLGNVFTLVIIHGIYTGITLFVLYKYSRMFYYLACLDRIISAGYYDVIDEKVYSQKRAESFAKIKNEEYLKNLKNR